MNESKKIKILLILILNIGQVQDLCLHLQLYIELIQRSSYIGAYPC